MREDNCMNHNNYDDIINLPHHVSSVHPHMAIEDRAAQFSAFAALTGYHDAVSETGRLTDKRIELDEDMKALLNEKLWMIQEQIKDCPKVSITYFCPDEKKEGGRYITALGRVKKLDSYSGFIVMEDGTKIWMNEILEIVL